MSSCSNATLRNRSGVIALLSTLVLALSPSLTRAATYTYNATLDLSTGTSLVQGNTQYFTVGAPAGAPTFTLAAGDTISGTISFLGQQTLNINSGGEFNNFGFSFSTSPGSNANYSSSVTPTGVSGSLNQTTFSYPSASTSGVISALVIGATPSNVSFRGFTYTIAVSNLTGGSQYTPANLYVFTRAGGSSVTGVSTAAPEPGSLALLLPIAGTIGLVIRRRNKN